MNEVIVKANAKVNLALAILYKRDDGYHEIDTIIQEIDFHDELHLNKSHEILFTCDDRMLPDDSTNLCVKAAALLKREFNIPGISIKLKKRIPIGSGLGGGSSDAAAVLKGARILYNLDVSDERLIYLAARLGSDVPFFISGGSCLARGRGEILKSIKMDTNFTILLITPNVEVSTVWAYKNLKIGLTKESYDFKFGGFKFHNLAVSSFRSEFYNDFEKIVFTAYPQLGEIKDRLYVQGAAFASLSGSGSAIFGIFTLASEAQRVQKYLASYLTCRLVKPVCSV
jgi:4-diphosphocytidyl-2-C-methyl-D-erythritol kinase